MSWIPSGSAVGSCVFSSRLSRMSDRSGWSSRGHQALGNFWLGCWSSKSQVRAVVGALSTGGDRGQSSRMPNDVVRYPRYPFPPTITSHAVWLYYRLTLSFRAIEDSLPRLVI